ncbi:hypothetical protein NQ317_002641 [Molorchus minor]|uniref:Uncharacterized protein n=1 Tax=Molorchus minor TaxID=1323400 RepID=A0ABQ9IY78_9CUCU|nr:hypothetical protein NQ317_002641 [Molorchus minor]
MESLFSMSSTVILIAHNMCMLTYFSANIKRNAMITMYHSDHGIREIFNEFYKNGVCKPLNSYLCLRTISAVTQVLGGKN